MVFIGVSDSFWPAKKFGGPIFSNFFLYSELSKDQDFCIEVFTTTAGFGRDDEPLHENMFGENFRVNYYPYTGVPRMSFMLLKGFYSFLNKTRSTVSQDKIVHLTGSYSVNILITAVICRFYNISCVWSPRGSLQYESASAISLVKTLWLAMFSKITRDLVIHVTSDMELISVRDKLWFKKNRIILLPNGIHTNEIGVRIAEDKGHPAVPSCYVHNKKDQLIFLGRIDRKKQVEIILEVLVVLEGYTLSVAGDGDENYLRRLKARARELGVSNRVRWLGFVDDNQKAVLFGRGKYLILPSKAENFGNVVLESLAHGVPVVASDGCPWEVLSNRNCGRCVPATKESISDAVRELDSLSYASLRSNSFALAMEFDWSVIGEKFNKSLRELLAGVDFRN